MPVKVNLPSYDQRNREWWHQNFWKFNKAGHQFTSGRVFDWCIEHGVSPIIHESMDRSTTLTTHYMLFEDPNKAMLFKLSCL